LIDLSISHSVAFRTWWHFALGGISHLVAFGIVHLALNIYRHTKFAASSVLPLPL
jgi:hypothetical protein